METLRKIGDCESCDKTNIPIRPLHSKVIWLCDECYNIEIDAQVDKVKADIAKRLDNPVNVIIAQTKQNLDSSIQIRTDLFNASTTAILDMKKSIDEDSTIDNKPFALALQLKARFDHFKQVVFEMNQKIVEAGNEQKAIQIYLNQLANTLRAEEREKIKLTDINYKPGTVKIEKPKAIKSSTRKIDKVELRKYAAELGVSEFTLQMVVVSKGLTVEAAANILRRSINESKSE
jgi:hypothetical protein